MQFHQNSCLHRVSNSDNGLKTRHRPRFFMSLYRKDEQLNLDRRSVNILIIMIGLSYLLPYHVHPFRAFYNEWVIFLGLLILLSFQIEQDTLVTQLPWVVVVPAFLIAIILLQLSFGKFTVRWDAILPLVYFFGCCIAICFGASIGNSRAGAYRLCYALAVGHLAAGLVSVGIGTLQFMALESGYGSLVMQLLHQSGEGIRPFANVGQPNQLALLFCMSLASVWWLYQADLIRGAIALVSTILLLWGITFTQSRIGWLIIPAFALLVLHWKTREKFKIVPGWAVFACTALYAGAVWMLPYIVNALGAETVPPNERIASDRLTLFKQALQISLDHPLLGAGWYEFGPEQVVLGRSFPGAPYSQHAHNIVLNFAAEIGWPLTLLTLGALAYWLIRSCFRHQISREVGFATLFFVAVLIHSMVEFPLWYAYVLIPTSLLVGLVHQEQFGSRALHVSRAALGIMCLIASLALVMVAVDYRRVVVGFRALGWQSLGMKADEGSTEKPTLTMFPHFYDYFAFAGKKAHEGMSPQEIENAERVMQRFGYAPVMMRMSLVYALNGHPDKARNAMLTIKGLHLWQYSEAYETWRNMSIADAGPYKFVFEQLPAPEGK